MPLVVGDVLLLRGSKSRARALADGRTLTFLSDVEYQQPRYGKAGPRIRAIAFSFVK